MSLRFTLIVISLLFTSSAYSQLDFDSKFRDELNHVDTDDDGEISQAEADAITELSFSGFSPLGLIESFNFATGIEHFRNLKTLTVVSHRYIVEMDLSMNKNLETIILSGSRINGTVPPTTGGSGPAGPTGPSGRGFLACDLPNLKEFIAPGATLESRDGRDILKGAPSLIKLDYANNNIDISVSTELEFIRHNPRANMDYTPYTELDTLILTGGDEINCSGLSQLRYFSANQAGLNAVNLTQCPQLDFVDVTDCNLETLDISGSELIIEILAADNNLTLFNYTSLAELVSVDFSDNNFADLVISEAPKLTLLNVSNNNLVQFELSNTPTLESLDCSQNNLVNLVLPEITTLTELRCNDNELENLDISNLVGLERLFANSNNLSAINTFNNLLLISLDLHTNQLENIDLNNNKELQILSLFQNNLSEFQLASLPLLGQLDISDNNLTSLVLDDLPLLRVLICRNNNLTSLDLSQLTLLRNLACQDNNLESLNIKNGNAEFRIEVQGNDNLIYICGDESDNNTIASGLADAQLSDVVFNAFCSFDFGGINKNVSGQVTYNQNMDDCNTSTFSFPFAKYEVTLDTQSFFFIGNSDGSHSVNIPARSTSYKVTSLILEDQFSVSPESVDLTNLGQDESLVTDFCVTPIADHENIEVILIPSIIRPGFSSQFEIKFRNTGNTIPSGVIRLEYRGEFLTLENSEPAIVSDDNKVLEWSYENLLPFETRHINFELTANTPTTSDNPLSGGEILNFKTTIYPIADDIEKNNNIHCVSKTVVNSFDPNDKTCLQGTTLDINNLDNFVDYLIRFENIGTASAVNVVVVDMIDTELFDISSLQIVEASHSMRTKITRNQVEFHFTDIFLPFEDEFNDGFVLFRIKPNSELVVGDVLQNQAEIYFDFNAPIVTNNYETTLIEFIDADNDGFNENEDCDDTDPNVNAFAEEIPNNGIDEDCDGLDLVTSSSSEIYGSNIVLQPNPATDILTISTEDFHQLKLDLYDSFGRKQNLQFSSQNVDVSSLNSGVYILQIVNQTSGQKTSKKIFVE